jgi:hypothetical protein
MFICNVSDCHRVLIEVDDRMSPCPESLFCGVYGLDGFYKIVVDIYSEIVVTCLKHVCKWEMATNIYEEEQNKSDCGVIVFQRAQLHLSYEHGDILESHFKPLGSITNYPLYYTDMILGHNSNSWEEIKNNEGNAIENNLPGWNLC